MAAAARTRDVSAEPTPFAQTAAAARACVGDVMVRNPSVHGPETTVGDLRAYFRDDHVHIALLVDGDRFLGAVERADLAGVDDGGTPATAVARLEGRAIPPDDGAAATFAAMRESGRRRLAVTTEDGTLLGLLCLKASGLGFCSDADVACRRRARRR